MEKPLQVWITDDEPTSRIIASAALDTADFAVREFADAAALLAALDDFDAVTPDLILLDVEMPGMDGIEACRALRAAGNDAVLVMFVSSHNDLETRMIAYEAGGDDFIVKPYEPAELARKARVAGRMAAHRQNLVSQFQYAQKTAFTAMSSMAEMGVVVEFLRNSFAADTPAALAGALLDTLRQFELDGLVGIRSASGRLCFSPQGTCSPLEHSILEHAAGLERIFQFRNRMVINYPGVTLLAHLPPHIDPEQVGRLRDHLAILAEGADTRLLAMETAQRQQAQALGIGEAIAQLTGTLAAIDRLQAEHRLRATQIDEAYLEQLTDAFVHLGLTEDQEKALADMAQRTHQQLAALRDEDSGISDQLRIVAHKLEQLGRT